MSSAAVDPAVQLGARLGLALLFASAAAHKLRDVGYFRAALEGYALLPAAWIVPLGAALIALELGVGIGLCLPRVAPVAAVAAAGLLLLYAAAIAVNLARGRRHIDCGCSGPTRRQALHPLLVLRNVLLAGAALLGALPATGRGWAWVDGVTVVAGVAASALLYAAANGLLANAARQQRRRGPGLETARA